MTIEGTGAMGGIGIGGSQAGDLLEVNKWFLIGSRIFLCFLCLPSLRKSSCNLRFFNSL